MCLAKHGGKPNWVEQISLQKQKGAVSEKQHPIMFPNGITKSTLTRSDVLINPLIQDWNFSV